MQLSDGREEKAKIVGTDGQIDLAVLKIDLPNLIPLPIGDSDKVKVGQIVMAIGNPFGLDESVESRNYQRQGSSGNERQPGRVFPN